MKIFFLTYIPTINLFLIYRATRTRFNNLHLKLIFFLKEYVNKAKWGLAVLSTSTPWEWVNDVLHYTHQHYPSFIYSFNQAPTKHHPSHSMPFPYLFIIYLFFSLSPSNHVNFLHPHFLSISIFAPHPLTHQPLVFYLNPNTPTFFTKLFNGFCTT